MSSKVWKVLGPAHGKLNLVQDLECDKNKILGFISSIMKRPDDFANTNDRDTEVIKDLKKAAESLLLNVSEGRMITANLKHPAIVKFKTQDFHLITPYHHLAYILSVTGSPKFTSQADHANYYLPYLQLFSQWNRVIAEAKYAPFASCIGVFRDIMPGDKGPVDYPFLMCTSGPKAHLERPLFQPHMARLLDEAGFKGATPEDSQEIKELYGNYGKCAESWVLSLMKRYRLLNITGITLKTSRVDIKVLNPYEIAGRLMPPCDTCEQLGKDADCADIMARFDHHSLRAILRQFSGPPK